MLQVYKVPNLVKYFFKGLEWHVPVSSKEIFLTFDDGPIPDLTEYVLDQLKKYNAKATFFCVGDNIHKYPDILQKVLESGHTIGNHTFNHMQAWKTGNDDYIDNVEKCQQYIQNYQSSKGKPLFRPPHGQITKKVIRTLRDNYRIIMWDVLAYDFDTNHSGTKSLKKVIKKTNPGSIIVFHDNYKAEEKLKYMLPKFLEHFSELGYKFKKLQSP